MNKETRGALLGMALGDGHINVGTRVVRGHQQERRELRIVHSLKQRDYCEHKAARVKQLIGGAFNVREYANGKDGKYRCVGFTATNIYFATLHRRLYPGGKKTFTRCILDMLTPEALAFWYMDDGSARRNVNKEGWTSSVATDIATMCSRTEVDEIIGYFHEVHGIEFRARCDPKCAPDRQWYVQCNTAQSRLFVKLVEPFIIPSMRYKLAHVADMDSHECQAPTGNCSQCSRQLFDSRRKGLCGACYSNRYYKQVRRFKEGRNPRVMR